MSNPITEREKNGIQDAIKAFETENLSAAGINLFRSLGYDTSLQAPLENKNFEEYNENYIQNSLNKDRFNADKAHVSEWKYVDILFQLTDASFSDQTFLPGFESHLNRNEHNSYLCMAIELTNSEYSKSVISNITREVNKLYTLQTIIIFKYGKNITFSLINRRLNRRDSEKDVLEKVTLIKDIFYSKPHRAHIEILYDMSLPQLSTKYSIYNFESLHKAWSEVLDTQTLNKRFYTELSNWYFWACKTVVFPGYGMESERETLFTTPEKLREHNAENLIRLLTRLLFVWFIKEKQLIPEDFFEEAKISSIIEGFEPHEYCIFNGVDPEKKSIYYKAILQNLFFAALNAEHGKRAFRIDGQNQNVTTLMRYKRFHKNPDAFVSLIESKVPFMNGGLFECLDHQDEELKNSKGGALIAYEDGFSDLKDNKLFVPDYIFFAEDTKVDLSEEYGDRRKRDVPVSGIINILKRYKFTIAENTPVEEDIALDPELLGRVFENLLASYNPETRTNARKQTGSFYTPRPIVEYMVDESLKTYFKSKFLESMPVEERGKPEVIENIENRFSTLISYNDSEPEFSETEKMQILRFIDNCKILDPACGSGAFPMGILQKLVYIIHKLDPHNDNWKLLQIKKIADDKNLCAKDKTSLIADISSVFDNNELDYGRKLYLIENCIHGVDIQPIATQISRLRFFISLIVDQTVDSSKENFGIRPLPNLENRFVTANSVILLNGTQSNLTSPKIEYLMKELKRVRHNLFKAKTPKYKSELRQKDKLIRSELQTELLALGFGEENARLLSSWDPYNRNSSAEFFDSEWMFGVRNGFDIVIGNPPYISGQAQGANSGLRLQRDKIISSNRFNSLVGRWDLYIPFVELGIQLNCQNGVTSMIVPFPVTNQTYAKKLRKMIIEENELVELVDLNGTKVFENATVSNCILFIKKATPKDSLYISKISDNFEIKKTFIQSTFDLVQDVNTQVWNVTQENREINRHSDMRLLGDFCYISKGMVLNSDENVFEDRFRKEDLISETQDEIHCRKFVEGKDCEKYCVKKIRYLEYDTERVPARLSRPTFKELYETQKLMVNRLGILKVVYDETGDFTTSDAMFVCLLWKDLRNVNNRSINDSIRKYSSYERPHMEDLSETVDLKYLLGIMNSAYASALLKNLRGDDYHIYPEHIRKIPIPCASTNQQQKIITLVEQILEKKKVNPDNDTTGLERQIDGIVYDLYGLTDEERSEVERTR